MKKEVMKFVLSNFTHNTTGFHIKKVLINENYKLHWHNYFEIEFIKRGAGYEIINGNRYEIKPGLFYLLLPTDLHEIHITEEAEIITLSFDYSIIPQNLSQNFYTSNTDFVFSLSDSESSFMNSILEELLLEFSNDSNQYVDEVIHSIMTIVLIFLIRKSHINFKQTEHSNAILTALNYINLHYSENPSLEKISNEVGLSPAYFCTAFKKYSGQSYSQYLIDVKISHAKKMLLTYQMPVIDIAMLCGFGSISNFNRLFKKVVGCSPLQYRKQNQ